MATERTLPPGFGLPDEEENPIPPEYNILFPEDGVDVLTKITETPPKMVLPLVRMRIINAAYDNNRKESLLELFVREFDRRMISRDRKGRLEAVRMLQASVRGREDEEEVVL